MWSNFPTDLRDLIGSLQTECLSQKNRRGKKAKRAKTVLNNILKNVQVHEITVLEEIVSKTILVLA